jgi:hypothetical protein
VLFLLIVGNSLAWAGWRFQGQNGTDENWGRGDNMTQVGSSDIWYYKISNLNNDIQFKINGIFHFLVLICYALYAFADTP